MEYDQLADVPDDVLADRWLLIYKNVGCSWTHPKVHEARKNGIVTVLEEADYFLDLSALRERVNELVAAEANRDKNRISTEMLTDDPGYLAELVAEGRVERDGETWGIDAERAVTIVESPV